jgi:lysophospholipase L1-like esterase
VGNLNAGISCNALTYTSSQGGLGAEARFERDALNRTSVSHAIVFAGTNDIAAGAASSAGQVTAALERMAAKARARGVRVLGATLIPRPADRDPAHEAIRRQVNDWIRTSGAFDGVLDFDAVLRDPADPSRMRADYDLDGVHPNAAGHGAMAQSIDLTLFDG